MRVTKKSIRPGLTSAATRRKAFIESYIANGGNATEAAKSAGYTERSAYNAASRLMRNDEVRAAIAIRARETSEKYGLTTELAARSIVQELSFDPAKLFNGDGSLKAIADLDEDTRMALVSVEFEQHGTKEAPVFVRKVKWAIRASARDHLMKHLGMFKEADARAIAASAAAGAVAAVAKVLDFEKIRERARRAASE